MTQLRLLSLTLLFCLSSAIQAAELPEDLKHLYLGGGMSIDSAETCGGGNCVQASENTPFAIAGLPLFLGQEGFGIKLEGQLGLGDGSDLSASLLADLPLDGPLSLLGRAGIDLTSGIEPLFLGIGANYRLNRDLNLRAEYQMRDLDIGVSMNSIAISLTTALR